MFETVLMTYFLNNTGLTLKIVRKPLVLIQLLTLI
jgi:hypothetical protein